MKVTFSNPGYFETGQSDYDVELHSDGKRNLRKIGSGYNCTVAKSALDGLAAQETKVIELKFDYAYCDTLKRFQPKWEKIINDKAFHASVSTNYTNVGNNHLEDAKRTTYQMHRDADNELDKNIKSIRAIRNKIDGLTQTLEGHKRTFQKTETLITVNRLRIEIWNQWL